MPQLIMLNHAGWVSSQRMDERIKRKQEQEEQDDNFVVYKGKTLDEMSSAELMSYYSDLSA